MALTYFFAFIAFAAVIWYVVTSIIIYNELKKRNIKVYFIFLNVMNPFYAYRYKKITEEETGSPGRLFYHWLIAINTALVCAVIAIILKNIYS